MRPTGLPLWHRPVHRAGLVTAKSGFSIGCVSYPDSWPRSWSGWGSIDRTGWKPCAASVDYSSRRRADRARSSMPRHAARGAGSRARRRLEPPLCRPLARRRAVNRHLHDAFTRRAWPPRALNSLPGAVSTGRTVQLLTSSDHAHTTVVSIGSVSDRLEARSGCAGRLLRPTSSCLNPEGGCAVRLLRPTSSWFLRVTDHAHATVVSIRPV